MYSRFSNNSDAIQIPEHYSGCAFPIKKGTPPLSKSPPAFLEVGKPSPTPSPASSPPPREAEKKEPEPQEPSPSPPPHDEKTTHDKPEKDKSIVASSPLSSLFGNLGSAFPFSHGLGFEELLILGLIILLSRNNDDSDLVLMLGLLLFCG